MTRHDGEEVAMMIAGQKSCSFPWQKNIQNGLTVEFHEFWTPGSLGHDIFLHGFSMDFICLFDHKFTIFQELMALLLQKIRLMSQSTGSRKVDFLIFCRDFALDFWGFFFVWFFSRFQMLPVGTWQKSKPAVPYLRCRCRKISTYSFLPRMNHFRDEETASSETHPSSQKICSFWMLLARPSATFVEQTRYPHKEPFRTLDECKFPLWTMFWGINKKNGGSNMCFSPLLRGVASNCITPPSEALSWISFGIQDSEVS